MAQVAMGGKSHSTRGLTCGVECRVAACEDELGGLAVRALEVELDMVGLIVRFDFGRCIRAL
jgi:hypothetical protein